MECIPYQNRDEYWYSLQNVEITFLVYQRIVFAEAPGEFDESVDDAHGDGQQTDVKSV